MTRVPPGAPAPFPLEIPTMTTRDEMTALAASLQAQNRQMKPVDRMGTAKGEIRRLVTALHQEIYNLRWNEGAEGEKALMALSDEYARSARMIVTLGAERADWNGGILEQADTAEAMAKLMAPKA